MRGVQNAACSTHGAAWFLGQEVCGVQGAQFASRAAQLLGRTVRAERPTGMKELRGS